MKYQTENPYVIMAYLKANKIPYKIKKTLFTIEVESKYGVHRWMSNNGTVPKNELFFISMLKRASDNIDLSNFGELNSSDVIYFNLPEKKINLTNCYEVDISAAYWHYAKDFLPLDVYNKGLTVSKQTRLIALGALAKTVSYTEFNGEDFIYGVTETEDTRSLFFYCAKKTSEVMCNIYQLCNKPVFFWVDAVFTSDKKDLQYIDYVLNAEGLTGKTYLCEKIISNDISIDVYSNQHKREKDSKEFRSFFKERKNSSYYINKLMNEKFDKKK